jgi:hypothetical protein
MKKRTAIISLIIVLLSPQLATSQKKAFFSLGAELGFPAGNYMEVGNMGVGGSVRFEHPWSKHVSGILTAEYIQYNTKETSIYLQEKFSALPIQFGVKYYTKEKAIYPEGIYFTGELGFTGEFYTTTFTGDLNNFVNVYHDTYVGFCNTMGAGYQLGIVDMGFRFQTIASTNSGFTSYYHFRLAFTIR